MATAKTGRPVGRPRKTPRVDLPEDRAEWYPEHWEEYLRRERLGMNAGINNHPQFNLRDTDQVVCLECVGFHTYDAGCYYDDGGEG